MEKDLLNSLKKSGLLLSMLLLFYAAFFADFRKVSAGESALADSRIVTVTEASDADKKETAALVDEAAERLQESVIFQKEKVQKLKDLFSVPTIAAVRYGTVRTSVRSQFRRTGRRIIPVMLLFLLTSGLWKFVSGSFYHCVQERHSDTLSLYSNPIRRGTPVQITVAWMRPHF